MIFISHRGNVNGPNQARENAPDYIDEAIKAGFIVEIDLRVVGESLFLGHDYPQYEVSRAWLSDRCNDLLIHVKDAEALKRISPNWHFFCHSSDPFTRTSWGHIWVHDLSIAPDKSCIVPLMTMNLLAAYPHKQNVHAICSDYQFAI
jgi:hypothetical protein